MKYGIKTLCYKNYVPLTIKVSVAFAITRTVVGDAGHGPIITAAVTTWPRTNGACTGPGGMKAMNNLDSLNRELLNLMQNDFPLTTRPYLDLARKLDISEDEVLTRIQAMKQRGLIRRTGAIIDSRKMGFYSTLCACRVEEERIAEVAAIINGQKGVTHNYVRDHYYNVWFTLTAPSYDEAMKTIRDIQQDAQIKVLAMPAIKTYKIKVSLDMGDR